MNEIIIEEVGEDYIHNTNGKGFFSILKSGKLKGKIQDDKITPNKKDVEICMSRSDMKPQHTGYSPSQFLKFGKMFKIVLNMDNIRKDLRLKKPYPVSYGYFNKIRGLKYELEKLSINNKIKTPEGKNIFAYLMKMLIDNSYQHQGMKKAPSEDEIKNILLKLAKIENIQDEINNALEAFYSVQEKGEERIVAPNGIPVNSKYMTIYIPDIVIKNDAKTINDAISDFKERNSLNNEEIVKLFKVYNDTSKTAYRRSRGLPKTSILDKLPSKFSY